jgi:competence protein ComFB
MEALVADELDRALPEFAQYCHCERCRLDMMAFALNNLPPRYIVADRGLTHVNLEATSAQFSSDVLYAVGKAIQLIGMRPRHANYNVGNRLLED